MMHDRVELFRQLAIDLSDRAIEGAGHVLVEGDRPGERLLDQRLHQLLRLIRRRLLGRRDDLVEEGDAFGGFGGGRLWCGLRA